MIRVAGPGGRWRRIALLSLLAVLPLATSGFDRPHLYRIPLTGVGPSSRLQGVAVLSPVRSPFGMAMTPDGFFRFTVEVDVPVMPPASSFGASFATYVAWVANSSLDRIERIGALVPGQKVKGEVAMNKFMVVITAEPNANGTKWTGPIVMRGNSPSSYLTNFSGHTMFNGGMPQ